MMPRILTYCLALLLLAAPAAAQDEQAQQQGPPPARVVTAKAEIGTVTPQATFVGTVRFPEVSATSSEVSGRVLKVEFEEGDHVKAGTALAELDTSLAQRNLASAIASFERVQATLERSRLDLVRIGELFRTKSVSESQYDDARYEVRELEKSAEAQMAEVSRLRLEIEKAVIRAPFDGVVIEKHTDRGEWLSPGSPVATVARDDVLDVLVDVPENVFSKARPGTQVMVTVAGKQIPGVVSAAIPSGEVTTRTFPVKIRIANGMKLAQGMEAMARMPSGSEMESVIVPRDAVILVQGQNVLYTAANGQAGLVPVTVHAYMRDTAAVSGPGLAAGADVIVKGQERLRPGQAVQPIDQ